MAMHREEHVTLLFLTADLLFSLCVSVAFSEEGSRLITSEYK